MAGLFMALFAGAAPLIDGIDHALKALAADVHRALGDGIFTDFLPTA